MAHIEEVGEEKIVHVVHEIGGHTYTMNVQDIPPSYRDYVMRTFGESLDLVYGRTVSNASSSLVNLVHHTIIV